MKSPPPKLSSNLSSRLSKLGLQLRLKRKALGISSTAAAEAAGISRVTLHRIEKGEPSVTMGAYLSVMDALGLNFAALDYGLKKDGAPSNLPPQIEPAKYPELKKLAWQIDPSKKLSPSEALEMYERNWKHIDQKNLNAEEKKLIHDLLQAFGRERLLV